MSDHAPLDAARQAESRLPPLAALLFIVLLLQIIPDRVHILPLWAPMVVCGLVAVPLIGATLSRPSSRWSRIEHWVVVAVAGGTIVNGLALLAEMVRGILDDTASLDGLRLLQSGTAVWLCNILSFGLLYWQLDRGGPAGRSASAAPLPDWRFPEDGSPPDVGENWSPGFVTYLYLAFSTATAFSATDVVPLTSRAKVLMMLQSMISLLTMVIVASRAINILQ